MGYSVTRRIKKIKQPYGGYIKGKDFEVIQLNDGVELNAMENENISPSLVGTATDYMTRFVMGKTVEASFSVPLCGARMVKEEAYARSLMGQIKGLDKESVFNACKLVGYDVCLRAGINEYKPVREINANQDTIENIIIMVNRSKAFWKQYGPIVEAGPVFPGGYTEIVSTGDGDYLTKDTLWDFKVSKAKNLKKEHTLQILMYYIMGCHSSNENFKNIKKLGFYNPRLNKVYLLSVDSIPKETIEIVSHEVIGYGLTKEEMDAILASDKELSLIINNEKEMDKKIDDIIKKIIKRKGLGRTIKTTDVNLNNRNKM